jgi:putative FmdB family regulatory protein
MAIYEYECEFCGKHTDEIQKMSDPHLVICPACGKPGLHRLVSAPAFQLKGTGWYVTDFRGDKKDKPGSAAGTHSSSSSKEESSATASTSTTDSSSSSKTEEKTAKTEKPSKTDKTDKT